MTKPLSVGFAGTPEFAKIALEAILEAGFDVPLVLTQPDRPAGRGMNVRPSPVKVLALGAEIPVLQPQSLKKGDDGEYILKRLSQANHGEPLDVLVVAAYGLILPQAILDAPKFGCLNIHASLLPRWRGAAPIHRAIEAGDTETGVCIMQMEAGLDTGPVRLRQSVSIESDCTTATLHDRLAALGGEMIVQALRDLPQGSLPLEPQPEAGITYADKISKAEGVMHLGESAISLARKIRAFDPFPGAQAILGGAQIKIFKPIVVSQTGADKPAGTVLDLSPEGVTIQCGQGSLLITEMQKPGNRRSPAVQVAKALGLEPGHHFEV